MLYFSTIQTILIRLKIKNTILTLQSFKLKGPKMTLKLMISTGALCCVYGISFAQEIQNNKKTFTKDTIIDGKIVSKSPKIAPETDSLKLNPLEDYQPAIDFDQKWIEELYSNSLFDSIYESIAELSYENVDYP